MNTIMMKALSAVCVSLFLTPAFAQTKLSKSLECTLGVGVNNANNEMSDDVITVAGPVTVAPGTQQELVFKIQSVNPSLPNLEFIGTVHNYVYGPAASFAGTLGVRIPGIGTLMSKKQDRPQTYYENGQPIPVNNMYFSWFIGTLDLSIIRGLGNTFGQCDDSNDCLAPNIILECK